MLLCSVVVKGPRKGSEKKVGSIWKYLRAGTRDVYKGVKGFLPLNILESLSQRLRP